MADPFRELSGLFRQGRLCIDAGQSACRIASPIRGNKFQENSGEDRQYGAIDGPWGVFVVKWLEWWRKLQTRFVVFAGAGVFIMAAVCLAVFAKYQIDLMDERLRKFSENEIKSMTSLVVGVMEVRAKSGAATTSSLFADDHSAKIGVDTAYEVFNEWFKSREIDFPGKLWTSWGPKTAAYMASSDKLGLQKPPRDEIDEEAIRTGRPVSRLVGGYFRYSAPFIFGKATGTDRAACRGCHGKLIGEQDGGVVSVLSAAVDISGEMARLRFTLWIAALVSIAGAISTMAGVHIIFDRQVGRRIDGMSQAMTRSAAGDYVPLVSYVEDRDELGDMARAAHKFILARQAAEANLATANRSLHESEERFRSLVENTSDWVWETDRTHCFSWISPSAEKVVGMRNEALLGKQRWDLVAESQDIDVDRWHSFIETLTALRNFRDFRYWVQTEGGQSRWISVSGAPRYDENGQFAGYRGSGSDVTAEASAAMRLRFLSTVVEQSPVSVVVTDPDGKIEYVNAHFTTVSGYGSQEVIGQNSRIFSSGETKREVFEDMWEKIKKGQRWEGELLNQRKNKVRYWESVIIAPVLNEAGQITHYASVKEDITERRDLEDQLHKTNSELLQFAYVVSHDLRQPLRMVSSYLGLIKKEIGDSFSDEQKKFFDYAVVGAKRMDRLITDLLDYSRTGQHAGSVPVPIGDAVADAVANLAVAIREAEAQISIAENLPTVQGDKTDLMRVFQNLIGNAIKYRSAERLPRIEIGWRDQPNDYLLWVKDNGMGIAEVHYERAFMVFQRLVAKDAYEGTGIGLAICKKIVEHSGGKIWIDSIPGDGSSFFMTFPHPYLAMSAVDER
ncbi:MAG TPA: PAS domain S-box protein [Rhodospirillaceae bacterium]|nr:PAS domain S-box protein [Rhodospirillaceae bacterium]